MKNILDRLIFALDAMGYKKHGRATQLSGITGYSVGMISDVLRGKTEVSERLLKIFCRELKLSEKWLRSGEGEMFAATPSGTGEGDGLTSEERALLDMVHGDEELLRDVIKYAEKEKLLKVLIKEQQNKEAG